MHATDGREEYEDYPEEGEDATCKFCGATGLTWIDTGVRWRLIGEDKKPHVCSVADDFEVIG